MTHDAPDHGHQHDHGRDHDHRPVPPELSRRRLLAAGAAGTALALLPVDALAGPLGPQGHSGTSRQSRLGRRTRLVHADLHNHSLQSDGAGDPDLAYESMRDAGLDVAALTDHSTVSRPLGPLDACAAVPPPPPGQENPCRSLAGLNEQGWAATQRYADETDRPGTFTAVRGFEWSSPSLGHVNVWFSADWTDPLSTAGFTLSSLAELGLRETDLVTLLGPLGPAGVQILELIRASEPAGMRLFYDWLVRSPNAVLGGGADGIAGFNHPNREPGTFDAFAFDPRVRERMVSMEILNRRDDYLFAEYAAGAPSPLVACLDAGWRVGLLGVTDEHGTDWGQPEGKGRAGLFVDRLNRTGVRSAMLRRDFFATNVRGLRLDAMAQGVPMGRTVRPRSRTMTFEVDLDRGVEHAGSPVEIQVLTSGPDVPAVVHVETVPTPAPSQRRPIRFRAPVDRTATSWVVLRIADPTLPNAEPGPAGHPCNNLALAYSSPFFLDGGRPPRSSGPRRRPPAAPVDALGMLLRGH